MRMIIRRTPRQAGFVGMEVVEAGALFVISKPFTPETFQAQLGPIFAGA